VSAEDQIASALAAEHAVDLAVVAEYADDPDTPEPVRPWARLFLAVQAELAPRGVQTGTILADARHAALVAALVDLGAQQGEWIAVARGLEPGPRFWSDDPWPVLDGQEVELVAVRSAVVTLLEIRAEIHRLDAAAREEHERAATRARLLEGIHPTPPHRSNGHGPG
jgi:hypothetical protein